MAARDGEMKAAGHLVGWLPSFLRILGGTEAAGDARPELTMAADVLSAVPAGDIAEAIGRLRTEHVHGARIDISIGEGVEVEVG